MRRTRKLWKQSWRWQVILLIASMAFGIYFVFDILDLDGSKLPFHVSSDVALAAEPSLEDGERVLRVDATGLTPLGPAVASYGVLTEGRFFQSASSVSLRILGARHPEILARHHICRESVPADSSSGDPA